LPNRGEAQGINPHDLGKYLAADAGTAHHTRAGKPCYDS
jgi:hypothetical protein